MDHNHKSWLWRKKSTERMIVASEKVDMSPARNEEMQTLLTAKAALEKDLKSANDKLSSCLSECSTKDDTIKKHVKMAEEAMAGWEDAELKAEALKQELDEALQQRVSAEERSTHLEADLKKSMQQLQFVREEQERRVHDAVMKASTEFEHSEKVLEDKLAETSRRNAELLSENTNLSKALLAREKLIEDLIHQKTRVETDLDSLMSRLKSTEKENASLEYEVQLLEKELEIRNEEREFNRRTADAAHKQHLESVKKIAKLESECQRLRVLVRKRLPGPAAMAKMRSEVDILVRDSAGRRRTKSSINGFSADSTIDNSLDTFKKRVNLLTEQLCALEEENSSLKEALNRKANELQVSRSMFARTASKLSQIESHFDELSSGRTSVDPSRRSHSGFAPYEHSNASLSDVGSEDKISCAESWASALISELEHFKHGKQRGSPSGKTVGASEMSLMDDFAEIERLAIVSVDKQLGSPRVSCDDVTAICGHVSEVKGREIVPISEVTSGVSNPEIESSNSHNDKAPFQHNNILKMVLEQARLTQRKPHEILEDVRAALANTSRTHIESKESENQTDLSNSANVGGTIPSTERKSSHMQTDLAKSVLKIIELVEGSTLPYNGALDSTQTCSDYVVRVLQWKTSELAPVLQKFIHTCYDLLNGKSDVNSFAQELTFALDWVINHCFSLQDVSSMKDAIKKHLDLDEAQSESEAEVGFVGQPEVNKISLNDEQLSHLSKVSDANGLEKSSEKDDFQLVTRDENISSVEMEMEDKESPRDELDATSFELQLQHESVKKNTIPEQKDETQLRSDWEITAASEKLAECQETILNLGKQLKALTTTTDTSVLEKDIPTPSPSTETNPVTPTKFTKQRSSLLDQMLEEDKTKTADSSSKSPKLKPSDFDSSVLVPRDAIEPLEKVLFLNVNDNVATRSLAIVPAKKQGGVNLWRKLLWRKQRSNIMRPALGF